MALKIENGTLPVLVIGGFMAVSLVVTLVNNHTERRLEDGGRIFRCIDGNFAKVDGHGRQMFCDKENTWEHEWCMQLRSDIWTKNFLKEYPEWNDLSEKEKEAVISSIQQATPPPARYNDDLLQRAQDVPACSNTPQQDLWMCLYWHEPKISEPTIEQCFNGKRTWTWTSQTGDPRELVLNSGELPTNID